MAESTRMKDITARLDTMMAIEQHEERLLAAMDQHDEHVNLMEQALSRLSVILESQQHRLQDNVTASTSVQLAVIREDDYHVNPSAHIRAIILDFPRFDCSEVLQWIYHAE